MMGLLCDGHSGTRLLTPAGEGPAPRFLFGALTLAFVGELPAVAVAAVVDVAAVDVDVAGAAVRGSVVDVAAAPSVAAVVVPAGGVANMA